jgi:3-hydroxyisobutyrate dehydrogenase
VTTVAVLGTGIMGAPMARNLLAAGFGVRAWNRTAEKAEALAGDGAEVAGTPLEAATGADAVVTMLADGAAVEAAMNGPNGALAALDGAPWIQMSTIGVAATERLKATAAEREAPFVDAPVLGTKQPAEEAQLVVLASGPEDEHERCTPIFDAVGRNTLWLGHAGAGSRLKMVVNLWILSSVETLGEIVGLARALDVDPESFLGAIDGGPLSMPYAEVKGRAMIDGEFPPSFELALARKDAELVLEAAADLELPVAQAVAVQFRRAEEMGYGEEDMAAVARVSNPDGTPP